MRDAVLMGPHRGMGEGKDHFTRATRDAINMISIAIYVNYHRKRAITFLKSSLLLCMFSQKKSQQMRRGQARTMHVYTIASQHADVCHRHTRSGPKVLWYTPKPKRNTIISISLLWVVSYFLILFHGQGAASALHRLPAQKNALKEACG